MPKYSVFECAVALNIERNSLLKTVLPSLYNLNTVHMLIYLPFFFFFQFYAKVVFINYLSS